MTALIVCFAVVWLTFVGVVIWGEITLRKIGDE